MSISCVYWFCDTIGVWYVRAATDNSYPAELFNSLPSVQGYSLTNAMAKFKGHAKSVLGMNDIVLSLKSVPEFVSDYAHE